MTALKQGDIFTLRESFYKGSRRAPVLRAGERYLVIAAKPALRHEWGTGAAYTDRSAQDLSLQKCGNGQRHKVQGPVISVTHELHPGCFEPCLDDYGLRVVARMKPRTVFTALRRRP